MTAASHAHPARPNGQPAAVFGISRTGVRSIDLVRAVARARWPTKTAAELSLRTGLSVRACEHWLAGRCGLTADALTNLLRSDAGLAILESLVGEARPHWWIAFKRQAQLSALRRAIEQQRRALERLEEKAGE